jgi:hypothetical protein
VGQYCETCLGILSAISVKVVFTFWHINLHFVFKFGVFNLFNSYLYSVYVKLEGVVGTGWSWLRIGTGGGHLWVR